MLTFKTGNSSDMQTNRYAFVNFSKKNAMLRMD